MKDICKRDLTVAVLRGVILPIVCIILIVVTPFVSNGLLFI